MSEIKAAEQEDDGDQRKRLIFFYNWEQIFSYLKIVPENVIVHFEMEDEADEGE